MSTSLDASISARLADAVDQYVLVEDQHEFLATVHAKADDERRLKGRRGADAYIERVIRSLAHEFNQLEMFRETG
jgi:hypothetical protein